jgi:hypothetical protein
MAFKMKGSPFLQGATTGAPETREVNVTSGRASNKSIRQFVRKVKDLGTGISGDITSTNANVSKEGSYVGSLLGLGDYYKKKDYGTVKTEEGTKQTEPISRKESRVLKRTLKRALKKGENVHVEGTKVTSGNEVKRKVNVTEEMKNREQAAADKKAKISEIKAARASELQKKKEAREAAKKAKTGGVPQRKSVLKKTKPNYKNTPLRQGNAATGEKLINETNESYEGEQNGRKGRFFKTNRTYGSGGTSGSKPTSSTNANVNVKGGKGRRKPTKTNTPGKTRNEENLTFRAYPEEIVSLKPAGIKTTTSKIEATPMPKRNIVTSLPEDKNISISAGGSKVRSNKSTKLFPGTFANKKARECTSCDKG